MNIFSKLREREIKGESRKPKEVCYIAVFNSNGYALSTDGIERIILPRFRSGLLENVIAYEKEADAEKNVLLSIEKEIKAGKDLKKIVTDKYLITHKKEDLTPNAYWIFTVESNATDITDLLSKQHPRLLCGWTNEEFGKKVLSAINTRGDTLIIASAVRERSLAI